MADIKGIVLVDENWGIGHEGKQPLFIKEDLQRFKALTTGTTVVYGRKTLATFPKGKVLPQRRNIILSRQKDFVVEGGEVCHSVKEVLSRLQGTVFVIGGASVYKAFLPHMDEIYVTKAEISLEVDCYFPNLQELPSWQIMECSTKGYEGDVAFYYQKYERMKPFFYIM